MHIKELICYCLKAVKRSGRRANASSNGIRKVSPGVSGDIVDLKIIEDQMTCQTTSVISWTLHSVLFTDSSDLLLTLLVYYSTSAPHTH